MLRMLTGPVRQLADLRSAPPDHDELAGASGCQDHLERQAAQLAGRQQGNAARHLADLSGHLSVSWSANQATATERFRSSRGTA